MPFGNGMFLDLLIIRFAPVLNNFQFVFNIFIASLIIFDIYLIIMSYFHFISTK